MFEVAGGIAPKGEIAYISLPTQTKGSLIAINAAVHDKKAIKPNGDINKLGRQQRRNGRLHMQAMDQFFPDRCYYGACNLLLVQPEVMAQKRQ